MRNKICNFRMRNEKCNFRMRNKNCNKLYWRMYIECEMILLCDWTFSLKEKMRVFNHWRTSLIFHLTFNWFISVIFIISCITLWLSFNSKYHEKIEKKIITRSIITQKQSRKTISIKKIARKASIERKKVVKKYKTKRVDEATNSDDELKLFNETSVLLINKTVKALREIRRL
jgi:hypothetical protein